MNKVYSTKEWKKMTEEYDKVKYLCKCGHRVIIPKSADKILCNWCGNYVFKNNKDEFKFRLEEEFKRGKSNN